MLLNTPGITLNVEDENFTVTGTAPLNLNARLVRKDRLNEFGTELNQLRYQQLWLPFAQLSRAVEWSLVELKASSGLDWGMTIVLFSLLLKILLVPLSIMSTRMQRQVSQHQSQLAPVLAEIKAKYDGEQAHIRIMAAHKELGISTFFVLKPMLLMFVQVPVWIAVFNVLGEMPQLSGSSFLWIRDLAYPDAIANLPTTIPLLGNSVNLLPFLMTAVTLFSARLAEDRFAPAAELSRQKRNLYLMALAFFVLFYPFPAAMVLYWTLSNVFHIVQQRWIKV
jgi:YidC/Oxa1 family membrane protein insertase